MATATIVEIIAGMSALLVALIGAIGEQTRRQSKVISEVMDHAMEARTQVQNSHKTNLRDDIDVLADRLTELLAGQLTIRADLSSVHRDMQQERSDRHALGERLDSHLSQIARSASK